MTTALAIIGAFTLSGIICGLSWLATYTCDLYGDGDGDASWDEHVGQALALSSDDFVQWEKELAA